MAELWQPHTGNTRVSGRRYLAHWLDSTLFVVLFLVLVVLAGSVLPDGDASNVLFEVVAVLGFTAGQVAYYGLTQRRHGRTPGKRLAGIRVVDRNGHVPSTGALVKRTIPLLVEYVYVIAWIGMMTSPFRQRLGDRWADTYVIADYLSVPGTVFDAGSQPVGSVRVNGGRSARGDRTRRCSHHPTQPPLPFAGADDPCANTVPGIHT